MKLLEPPTGLAATVLGAILDYAQEHEHWPNTQQVTAYLGLEKHVVRRHLHDLKLSGWLERRSGIWRCPQATLSLEYDLDDCGQHLRDLLENYTPRQR